MTFFKENLLKSSKSWEQRFLIWSSWIGSSKTGWTIYSGTYATHVESPQLSSPSQRNPRVLKGSKLLSWIDILQESWRTRELERPYFSLTRCFLEVHAHRRLQASSCFFIKTKTVVGGVSQRQILVREADSVSESLSLEPLLVTLQSPSAQPMVQARAWNWASVWGSVLNLFLSTGCTNFVK